MAVQRYKNANGEWVVLGTELKTINGQSIIGQGNITIDSGVTEDYVNNAIANAITTTLNTAV